MIDVTGAIYIIGGYNGTYLSDVWVSTDGGADKPRHKAVFMMSP